MKYLRLSLTPAVLLPAILLLVCYLLALPLIAASEELHWKGCTVSKKAFMAEAAEAYFKQTGVKIWVGGGGSARGISDAADCIATFGGSCRDLEASLNEKKLGLESVIVGWDALVAITHPDNKVSDLSKSALRQILRGDIVSWKEVGGSDLTISLGARPGRFTGVGVMMRKIIMNDLKFDFPDSATILTSSELLEQLAEKSLSALVITGVSSARRRKVKILSIGGAEPTQENIASGKYPFFRPLYLTYNPDCSDGDNKKFANWLIGENGQKVIEEIGTVSLHQGRKLINEFKYFSDDSSHIKNMPELKKLAQVDSK